MHSLGPHTHCRPHADGDEPAVSAGCVPATAPSAAQSLSAAATGDVGDEVEGAGSPAPAAALEAPPAPAPPAALEAPPVPAPPAAPAAPTAPAVDKRQVQEAAAGQAEPAPAKPLVSTGAMPAPRTKPPPAPAAAKPTDSAALMRPQLLVGHGSGELLPVGLLAAAPSVEQPEAPSAGTPLARGVLPHAGKPVSPRVSELKTQTCAIGPTVSPRRAAEIAAKPQFNPTLRHQLSGQDSGELTQLAKVAALAPGGLEPLRSLPLAPKLALQAPVPATTAEPPQGAPLAPKLALHARAPAAPPPAPKAPRPTGPPPALPLASPALPLAALAPPGLQLSAVPRLSKLGGLNLSAAGGGSAGSAAAGHSAAGFPAYRPLAPLNLGSSAPRLGGNGTGAGGAGSGGGGGGKPSKMNPFAQSEFMQRAVAAIAPGGAHEQRARAAAPQAGPAGGVAAQVPAALAHKGMSGGTTAAAAAAAAATMLAPAAHAPVPAAPVLPSQAPVLVPPAQPPTAIKAVPPPLPEQQQLAPPRQPAGAQPAAPPAPLNKAPSTEPMELDGAASAGTDQPCGEQVTAPPVAALQPAPPAAAVPMQPAATLAAPPALRAPAAPAPAPAAPKQAQSITDAMAKLQTVRPPLSRCFAA